MSWLIQGACICVRIRIVVCLLSNSPSPNVSVVEDMNWPWRFLYQRHSLTSKLIKDFSIIISSSNKPLYDPSGLLLSDQVDRCDCNLVTCPGCFVPCAFCLSCKCGLECRTYWRHCALMQYEIECCVSFSSQEILERMPMSIDCTVRVKKSFSNYLFLIDDILFFLLLTIPNGL